MAAGTFAEYTIFRQKLGEELHNLSSDTLKCALFTTAHTPAASHVTFSVLTGEVGTTNTGYTAGGVSLAQTWTGAVLNASNSQWTAGSAGLTAKWAVIYNTTAGATNNLVAYVALDTSTTVSVTNGNNLTIDYNDTDGIVKLT